MRKNRESIRKNIGKFLREARVNRSLSGCELGRLMNISQQQISRYELGKNSINIDTLDIMLEVLGKDWKDLFSIMINHSNNMNEIK